MLPVLLFKQIAHRMRFSCREARSAHEAENCSRPRLHGAWLFWITEWQVASLRLNSRPKNILISSLYLIYTSCL